MNARSTRAAAPAVVALSLAAALCAPCAVACQSTGSVQIGAHAGFLWHSALGLVDGTLLGIGSDGLPVHAVVEAESSTLFGGQVIRRLTTKVDLRLRVATTTTHVRLVADTKPTQGTGGRFTFTGLGHVAVWLLDVDAVWTPYRSRVPVAPYLSAGIGASYWRISGLEHLAALPPLLESPVSIEPVTAFLPGAVVGIGLAMGPFERLNATLEVTDHVTGDPISDDNFQIGAQFEGFGRAKNLVHNLSATAGARIAFGG